MEYIKGTKIKIKGSNSVAFIDSINKYDNTKVWLSIYSLYGKELFFDKTVLMSLTEISL